MNSKKNNRASSRGKRGLRGAAGSAKSSGQKQLVGREDLRKVREERAADEAGLADAGCEGGAGKRNLLSGGAGEQTASRGAPPALPTPIATFTI
jgi:hypothetical protein